MNIPCINMIDIFRKFDVQLFLGQTNNYNKFGGY